MIQSDPPHILTLEAPRSKNPQHPQSLPGKVKTRRPSPHNWKANALEYFSRQASAWSILGLFFARTTVESFHLRVLHTMRSASHSAHWKDPTRHVAFAAIPSPLAPAPLHTSESWLAEAQWLARDILRDQEEHRLASLLRPSATLFHCCKELHHFTSRFINPMELLGELHHILHPSLPRNSSLPVS